MPEAYPAPPASSHATPATGRAQDVRFSPPVRPPRSRDRAALLRQPTRASGASSPKRSARATSLSRPSITAATARARGPARTPSCSPMKPTRTLALIDGATGSHGPSRRPFLWRRRCAACRDGPAGADREPDAVRAVRVPSAQAVRSRRDRLRGNQRQRRTRIASGVDCRRLPRGRAARSSTTGTGRVPSRRSGPRCATRWSRWMPTAPLRIQCAVQGADTGAPTTRRCACPVLAHARRACAGADADRLPAWCPRCFRRPS